MDMVRGPDELHRVIAAPARWWVGFTDADVDKAAPWYHAFTRPGFRHCFAFRALADEVILLVNPMVHRIDARSFAMRPDEMIRREREAGAKIVTVTLQPDMKNPPRRGPILTCASVVAYTMGLDTRAITPYGLFRSIMANGGREL